MVWPTAPQWLEWFESLTPKRKLEVAEVVCRNMQAAARCQDYRHEERIADFRGQMSEVLVALKALQDEVAEQSIDDEGEWLPSSQSDPESLPGGVEQAVDHRTRERMPEEEIKRDHSFPTAGGAGRKRNT